MMVCGVSHWGHWGHSHLNRFWDLMNRCRSLLGSKATSSDRLEFSIKSSLGFSNLQNVIKIGISNLGSLNIVVNRSKSSMFASSGYIKSSLERSLSCGNIRSVLQRSSSSYSKHTGKDQGVHDERFEYQRLF